MEEGEQRNKKGTVKEYETYGKLGVGIGGNFGHEEGDILYVFCGSRFGDDFLVECIVSRGWKAKDQKRNSKGM